MKYETHEEVKQLKKLHYLSFAPWGQIMGGNDLNVQSVDAQCEMATILFQTDVMLA